MPSPTCRSTPTTDTRRFGQDDRGAKPDPENRVGFAIARPGGTSAAGKKRQKPRPVQPAAKTTKRCTFYRPGSPPLRCLGEASDPSWERTILCGDLRADDRERSRNGRPSIGPGTSPRRCTLRIRNERRRMLRPRCVLSRSTNAAEMGLGNVVRVYPDVIGRLESQARMKNGNPGRNTGERETPSRGNEVR